jgi:hypothetical protein
MKKNFGTIIRSSYDRFKAWREYANSRRQAHVIRERVTRAKGSITVDRKMIRQIKNYSGEIFGNEGYWPWLAVYTELRGEFIEGWMPDDFYKLEMIPALNPRSSAGLSKVKSYDHRLFPGFAIEPIAVRISGRFYDHEQNPMTDTEFQKCLQDIGAEIVLKEDGAASGRGIVFKKWIDISRDDFKPGSNYVIQPSVKQHRSLNELYSHAINTVRVATYLSPEGRVSVNHLSLRTGSKGRRLVNVSRGGMELILNNEGCVISNALDYVGLETGSKHPETGFPYKELRVPSIPEAIRRCREAHHLFPYVRFIAWDLYIDEIGNPKMIEWNAWMPDVWTNEALTGPLWKDLVL